MIDTLFKPLASGHPGSLDLVDDAAVLAPPAGCELVIAKDAMVEGVHFFPDDPPDSIAGKLMRVNVSDLAAMGADPLGYLLVVARSPHIDDVFLKGFAEGLALDQEMFGLTLLGGDTVSTGGPLCLSLTILGTVPTGQALRRSGASAGDEIWVSGTLGDAEIGL
ncbi:MAG: thiamine-phosphate kinase, partial [Pseudomonadota bacterium]